MGKKVQVKHSTANEEGEKAFCPILKSLARSSPDSAYPLNIIH